MIDTLYLTDADKKLVFNYVLNHKIKIVYKFRFETGIESGIIKKRNNKYLFFENGDLFGLCRNLKFIAEIHLDDIQLENKINKILKFKNLYKN
jgi:hypothetical protein